jgi:hypothetical protein
MGNPINNEHGVKIMTMTVDGYPGLFTTKEGYMALAALPLAGMCVVKMGIVRHRRTRSIFPSEFLSMIMSRVSVPQPFSTPYVTGRVRTAWISAYKRYIN